jgi:activating signal cointegrator 1
MKTLTVKQPFASLIASGNKKYEFRSWKTSYRGPLLIHSSKQVDKGNLKRFEYLKLDYPTSKILCQVSLKDCILVTKEFKDQLLKEDKEIYKHASINEYAWVLEDLKQLDIKETILGRLSLWEYDI